MRPALAILLRHAERDPLPPGQPGDHVRLTPAGRAAATSLGAVLGQRITRMVSSPVERCLETAECLLSGAGLRLAVETSPLLGAPGAFVTDPATAWQAWLELGEAEMITRLMTGAVERPGFRSRAAGTALIADLLRTELAGRTPGEVVLLVTHDVVLGPVAAEWFPNMPFAPPAFLERLQASLEEDTLHAVWREARADVWGGNPSVHSSTTQHGSSKTDDAIRKQP